MQINLPKCTPEDEPFLQKALLIAALGLSDEEIYITSRTYWSKCQYTIIDKKQNRVLEYDTGEEVLRYVQTRVDVANQFISDEIPSDELAELDAFISECTNLRKLFPGVGHPRVIGKGGVTPLGAKRKPFRYTLAFPGGEKSFSTFVALEKFAKSYHSHLIPASMVDDIKAFNARLAALGPRPTGYPRYCKIEIQYRINKTPRYLAWPLTGKSAVFETVGSAKNHISKDVIETFPDFEF